MGMWQVVREIYWCERNNKNKWHIYWLTGDIKLVYTLSFTFKDNCGTNLKALLECMNRKYFFPFYTKIKKKKVKFQNLIFFCSWCMVRWFSLFWTVRFTQNQSGRSVHWFDFRFRRFNVGSTAIRLKRLNQIGLVIGWNDWIVRF